MPIDMTPGRQQPLDKNARKTTLNAAVFVIEAVPGGSAAFSELGGISSEVEMVEYMEAGPKGPEFGRFLGKAKPPTVVLKRAMSTGPDTTWIWAWHALARKGGVDAYKDVTLKLISAADPAPLKTYSLKNAVATKVEIAGAKAGASEVIIQTLTIQCDEIHE